MNLNKPSLIALLGAFLVAPFALAHEPAGLPKNYCEPMEEWQVHDYGPPATGILLSGPQDGNLAECDGLSSYGSPCVDISPRNPLEWSAGVCGLDPPIADFDGHLEFAHGGAYILAVTGNGEPLAFPGLSGTLYCYGLYEHHMSGPATVVDVELGTDVTYYIGVDRGVDASSPPIPTLELSAGPTSNPKSTTFSTGDSSACGDGLIDEYEDCTGQVSCQADFPAGIDGAFYVFVQGTRGHVYWP